MKALCVSDFRQAPQWTEFNDPIAADGQAVVQVKAAALSNLVRGQANGTHYTRPSTLPFVPGMDGVGRLTSGERVFFFSSLKPFGAMAEHTLVRKDLCVPLPDDLEDTAAAALANPAMSSWAALSKRAKIQRDESVLINGATGTSGRLAVKIAKHLGAKKVIVTGRDARVLEELLKEGADEKIVLSQDKDLSLTFRERIYTNEVAVILDYLWGPSAEALISAIGGPGAKHDPRRIRYVQIGSIAGTTIPLPASALRSVGLELMGSGLGSVSDQELVQLIGDALRVATRIGLSIEHRSVPMSEAGGIWNQDTGRERLIFTL